MRISVQSQPYLRRLLGSGPQETVDIFRDVFTDLGGDHEPTQRKGRQGRHRSRKRTARPAGCLSPGHYLHLLPCGVRSVAVTFIWVTFGHGQMRAERDKPDGNVVDQCSLLLFLGQQFLVAFGF